MTSDKKKEIRKKIIEGIEKAYQKLLDTKKKTGEQLVISQDGKVVVVNPNEI